MINTEKVNAETVQDYEENQNQKKQDQKDPNAVKVLDINPITGHWAFNDYGNIYNEMNDYFYNHADNKTEIPEKFGDLSMRGNIKLSSASDIQKNKRYKNEAVRAWNDILKNEGIDSTGLTSGEIMKLLNEKIVSGEIAERRTKTPAKEETKAVEEKKEEPKTRKSINDITDEEDARIAGLSGIQYLDELLNSGMSEDEAKKAMESFNARYPNSDWKGVSFDIDKAFSERKNKVNIEGLQKELEKSGFDINTGDPIDYSVSIDNYISNLPEEERNDTIKSLEPSLRESISELPKAKSNEFVIKWANKFISDPEKRDEWLKANPTPMTAIFGDSGLGVGQRLGLALGLLAAISSDALAGYNAGLNHTTANPAATENFLKPFKEINQKNIERITNLKGASTEAETNMEKLVSEFKQIPSLKGLPNTLLASLISFFQNPNNKISEENLKEFEPEFQKAYQNLLVDGENISDHIEDYKKWKSNKLKNLISKLGIDSERLENANKFLDIATKETSLSQQISKFEFDMENNVNKAIAELRQEERELNILKKQAQASDTTELLNIAGKYRDVVAGLSTSSKSNGESKSEGSTAGKSSEIGGEVSGGAGVKKIAHISASAHGNFGWSNTETETSGTNKNIATYEDAANNEVYSWLNDEKIKGDLKKAKDTLIKAIDAQLKAVQSAIEELNKRKNKGNVSFDEQLNNLYETGFYERPRIKNNDYYRYRMGLV